MTGQGMMVQWRRASFAMRAIGHVSAAGMAGSRSPKIRLGMLGVSLASDALLAWNAGTGRRSRWLELGINAVDLAAWSAVAREEPTFVRTAVIATVVPTAIENGFRMAAGIEAVPHPEPARPWEPAWNPSLPRLLSLRWSRLPTVGVRRWLAEVGAQLPDAPTPVLARWAELVAGTLPDALVPLSVAAVVRRSKGARLGGGPIGWVVLGAVGGYALARARDDAQRSTRSLWAARTESVVEAERAAAHVQGAAIHSSWDVDPKAGLSLLGQLGSQACAEALLRSEVGSRQAQQEHAAFGTTLYAAVERRDLYPLADRGRWVSEEQVGPLLDFLEDVERRVAGSAGPIEVVSTDGPEITLRYAGEQFVVERPVPELTVRLDPAVATVALGTVWSALAAVPSLGGLPPWSVAPAVLLDGVALWGLVTRSAPERKVDPATLAKVVGAAIWLDGMVALRHRTPVTAGGFPISPATGASQGAAMLLVQAWPELPRRTAFALLVTLGAAWSTGYLCAGRRPRGALVQELGFLAMPALAVLGAARHVREEADLLDEVLDQELAARFDGVASDEAARAVASYRAEVDLILGEASRLRREGVDPEILDRVIESWRSIQQRLDATSPEELINWT